MSSVILSRLFPEAELIRSRDKAWIRPDEAVLDGFKKVSGLVTINDFLADTGTGRGMERLLKDRGIHREYFIPGRADAVAMLVEATGHTVDNLQRNAIRMH